MKKKLVHPDWEFQIDMSDGSVTLLVVENRFRLRKYVVEMTNQGRGEDGDFVLSGENEISLKDRLVIIVDPLNTDFFSKRIATRVQQQIKEGIMAEDCYIEAMELLSHIERFAESLESSSWLNLTHDQYNIDSLGKILNLYLAVDYENEVERILEYMNVMQEVCGVDCFVFVSLFDLFDTEEIETIVREASANKHNILFLESREPESTTLGIRKIVIDRDFCQIF